MDFEIDFLGEMIATAYEPCNGSPGRAVKYLEREHGLILARSTVESNWKRFGLETRKLSQGNKKISKEEEKLAVKHFHLYEGNASRAVIEGKMFSHTTYLKCWRKYGLIPSKKSHTPRFNFPTLDEKTEN